METVTSCTLLPLVRCATGSDLVTRFGSPSNQQTTTSSKNSIGANCACAESQDMGDLKTLYRQSFDRDTCESGTPLTTDD